MCDAGCVLMGVALFEAARLSAWGLGIVLAWLLATRALDAAGLRWAPATGLAVAVPSVRAVKIDGALVAGLALCAFTPAILGNYVVWLDAGAVPKPVFAMFAVWALIALELRLLARLAYHPRFKVGWALGWIGFAHLTVLLDAL